MKNKTKIEPRYDESGITIKITTKTDTALDEINGTTDYLEEELLNKLKKAAEASLEEQIRSLVKKTQDDYGSDIFGFGKKIKIEMPDFWKQLEPRWNEMYKEVAVEVHSVVNIKNSGIISKPIKKVTDDVYPLYACLCAFGLLDAPPL